MRLGAHNAFDSDVASGIFLGGRIAIEDDVDQTQDHVASAIGKAWLSLGVFAGASFDRLVDRMRDEDQAVWQTGQSSQHTMPFVLDQCPAFAMAHVALVLDAMLGTDIVRTHLESVVDGVDHNRFEVVIALGHKLASFEECLHE